VLDGTVLGQCMQRHRHQEFLRFLNAVEAAVPAGKLVHAILDNYGTHKHPEVLAWLGRHPRWTFHFVPDLLLVAERGRDLLRQADPRRLRRGSFHSLGRPAGGDQPLRRGAQAKPEPVRLDRRPGPHHREGPPQTCGVGVGLLGAARWGEPVFA
jgi:hypothetical protein